MPRFWVGCTFGWPIPGLLPGDYRPRLEPVHGELRRLFNFTAERISRATKGCSPSAALGVALTAVAGWAIVARMIRRTGNRLVTVSRLGWGLLAQVRFLGFGVSAGWLAGVLAGCASPGATVRLLDYSDSATPQPYVESFPEAYYALDHQGNVDLVLRRVEESSAGEGEVVQLVHLRSFWRSLPGRTVADATQINAAVRYEITTAGERFRLEGAGSVFFSESLEGDELVGSVDEAHLKAAVEAERGELPFSRVKFSARFRAQCDRRRVTRWVNELDRSFPPPPGRGAGGGRPRIP